MESTNHLKNAIESVTHSRFLTKTFARVFQSIRIHINGELDALKIASRIFCQILKARW